MAALGELCCYFLSLPKTAIYPNPTAMATISPPRVVVDPDGHRFNCRCLDKVLQA